MILFDNTTTIPGITISDTLAYVQDVEINSDRISMNTTVSLSLLANVPDYAAYTGVWPFQNIPYDSHSHMDEEGNEIPAKSPSSQCYAWLMTQPEFTGGTQYPPVE